MSPNELFIKAATEASLEDRTRFRDLVSQGLDLTGMSLREAAREFKTAPGTVSRWVNGHSAPAVVAREAIIKFFRARVRRIVQAEQKRAKGAKAKTRTRKTSSKTLKQAGA